VHGPGGGLRPPSSQIREGRRLLESAGAAGEAARDRQGDEGGSAATEAQGFLAGVPAPEAREASSTASASGRKRERRNEERIADPPSISLRRPSPPTSASASAPGMRFPTLQSSPAAS